MLTKCPECELQVSDKALTCPHCGYPLADERPTKVRKSSKHMRLPNGFGQITELKNKNLRNRFRVMVSVGKKPNGRPICKLLKPIAYFPTYNDAYKALVEYNKNPYDLDDAITVKELYERWKEFYYPTITDGGVRGYKSAWSYCASIYSMRVMDVRPRHIKGCMEEGTALVKGVYKEPTAGVKARIKSMFNMMLDYALEHDIVEKNYSRAFSLSEDISREIEDNRKAHMVFTDDEMEILWQHIEDVPYVDIIIYQCYSGWRPQELGLITLANVNFEENIIIGGMKTEAGKMRRVPIHDKIRHIVERRYKEAVEHNSKYLFNCFDESARKGYRMGYTRYRQRFMNAMEALSLDPEHKPHDPRKHFVTKAKKYKVDDFAVKLIAGHEIDDVTEKYYTERENSWLVEEINKIDVGI